MKLTATTLIAISLIGLSCSTGKDDALAASQNALVILTVLQLKNADRSSDADTLFAEKARIWFETKDGEGKEFNRGKAGPWAEWDKFFNAKKLDQNIKAYPDSVVVLESEQNDFYLLIERQPKPMAITYYFDENGKISGKMVVGIKTIPAPTDRFDEAVSWLRTEHPDDLKLLMPDNEIVPNLENAVLWKQRLNEWRTAIKLDTI